MTSPQHPMVLPGVELQRTAILSALTIQEKLPEAFPSLMWNEQQARYREYWNWFNGIVLMEEKGKRTEGQKATLKFPLGINVIRTFARKHAAVLLGEDTSDSPKPLVRTLARPKQPLSGDQPSEADKEMAQLFSNLVNEVWLGSGGRALQVENATMTQFLGGCVFQLKWEPWRKDLLIPITIHNIPPDFFLPVWSARNYWELHEAYIVYRIPVAVAQKEYGFDGGVGGGLVTYCEHWTKNSYSIYLNGVPMQADLGDGKIRVYKDMKNPFGFVPMVYIPHLKEGNNYGSSHVPDLAGLIKEFNARMADNGDIVRIHARRKRIGFNMQQTKVKQFGESDSYIDIGNENPAYKSPPTIKTEDPPSVNQGIFDFARMLWQQLLREGCMGDIAFGEDEGSQRSALTLAFRMYPTTAHARMERSYWTEGLNTLAKMIGQMAVVHADIIEQRAKIVLPKDFLWRIEVWQDWLPMIPRDREQMVTEITTRLQSASMSIQKALEDYGDVRNVEDEINLIKEWQTFQASVDRKMDPNAASKNLNPIKIGGES